MTSLLIEPVENDGALREFMRLPPRLYERFPEYVPPLTIDRKGLFDPKKAPFHKHGKAKYWIARRNGEAVGRISAQIDHAQPGGVFADGGLFGSLDTIDDGDVVAALIAVAEEWLRDQGCTHAIGPCTLSMNGEPGLLVDGHEEPPLIGTSWHPKYLEKHLEQCGYRGIKDLHFWRIESSAKEFAELHERPALRNRLADYSTRNLDVKNLSGEIETIRKIYNDAWQDNWGFVPLEPHDLDAIASDMKPYIRAEYGVIVEHKGDPVGVAVLIPNLYEITGDVGPDPSPLGWAKLGWRTAFHRFSTGRIILLGVQSKLKNSVGGAVIAMSMVNQLIGVLADYKGHVEWIEAGWVLEDNAALVRLLEQFGFSITRTFRILQKDIGTPKEAN